VKRGNPIADPIDLEARLRESSLQAVAEQGVVFDEEKAHRNRVPISVRA